MLLADYKTSSRLAGPPDLAFKPPDPSQILRNRNIICFAHDFTADPLSKTQIMRVLSRDNRILWVNSVGYRTPTVSKRDLKRIVRKLIAATTPLAEQSPNIFVLNPLAIPAFNPAIRAFNREFLRFQVRRAMEKLSFRHPVNFVFNPAAAVVAGQLGEETLIYYCVDEYAALSGMPSLRIIEMERHLIERADHVFVSAKRLHQTKSKIRPDIHLVRHGVDFDHFAAALAPSTPVHPDLADLPKPIIGYFGLIDADWIDLPLLEKVARRFLHASLVMIGKCTMDLSPLKQYPNVHLLGRKPYAELPRYCKGFDVALIPFPISELTLNANPLKAREYLAAGLPTVSTAIPEVQVLGNKCLIGRDHDDFCNKIAEALQAPGPLRARSESIRCESWTARVDQIRACIASSAP